MHTAYLYGHILRADLRIDSVVVQSFAMQPAWTATGFLTPLFHASGPDAATAQRLLLDQARAISPAMAILVELYLTAQAAVAKSFANPLSQEGANANSASLKAALDGHATGGAKGVFGVMGKGTLHDATPRPAPEPQEVIGRPLTNAEEAVALGVLFPRKKPTDEFGEMLDPPDEQREKEEIEAKTRAEVARHMYKSATFEDALELARKKPTDEFGKLSDPPDVDAEWNEATQRAREESGP